MPLMSLIFYKEQPMPKGNKKKQNSKKPSHRKNLPAKQPVPTQSSLTNPQTESSKGVSVVNLSAFTTQITMLSDWHIGTGAGRPGDIDRLVQRDQDGFPYIPAKTLTGIWRDACETVAWGLDNGESATWVQWVKYLFGDQPALKKGTVLESPQSAALSVRGAYLHQDLKAAITTKSPSDQTRLKEAIAFVKPGISIDPDTGCAKEDFLRFEEMVRAGAVLTAACQLDLNGLNDDQQRAVCALLIAGSYFIERIGGKRRRGAGRCKVTLQEISSDSWLNWLEQNPQPPSPPSERASTTVVNWHQHVANHNSAWVAVPLKITAKSPLIITSRTVGNVVETLDYIPGTHLLRLIVRKLKSTGVDLSGAIAHGDLIVTNATISVEGQRGRPVPYALFGEKLAGGLEKREKGAKVYNRFAEPEPDHQLKAERQGYIGPTPKSNLPNFGTVKTGIETHNIIQDDVQCPTRDVGGVYSYETILPGTVFQAELRLPMLLADQLADQDSQWTQKLVGQDRLGQSKKDNYGRVEIEVLPPIPPSKPPTLQNSQLVIWLLSDLLLRDERLRSTADPNILIQTLENQLGVSLQLRNQLKKDEDTDHLLSLMARQNRLESWQVRWGLPRPSLAGLAAGSCFVFEVNSDLDASKLAQLESKLTQLEITGLGERRAEGYGQICFNDQMLTVPTSGRTATAPHAETTKSSPKLLKQGSHKDLLAYAQVIEQAAARQVIRRAALRIAADDDRRKQVLEINKDKPTMSQLGALRSVINRLQEPEHLNQTSGVMGWLQHLKKTPNRKDKWPPKSLQQIEDLVCKQETIWRVLTDSGKDIDLSNLTLIKGGEAALKQRLWAEAVQTLVDACIRAHKRDSEKSNDEDSKDG
jgi:CRISPR-associated protein Csx10